jgi:hypothetical protein
MLSGFHVIEFWEDMECSVEEELLKTILADRGGYGVIEFGDPSPFLFEMVQDTTYFVEHEIDLLVSMLREYPVFLHMYLELATMPMVLEFFKGLYGFMIVIGNEHSSRTRCSSEQALALVTYLRTIFQH